MLASTERTDFEIPPADSGQEPRRRRRYTIVVKSAVTIAIFAFLFSHVDLAQCATALGNAHSAWLAAAFAANVLALITSTLKWDVLLRALGIFLRKYQLLKIYTIGFFMNACLPGVVGGDVIRCQLTGPGAGGRVNVAATIVAERVVGVAALVLLCLIAVVCDSARLATTPILILLTVVAGLLLGGVGVLLNHRVACSCIHNLRRFRLRFLARILSRLHRALRSFSRADILVALVYSFLFYSVCGLIRFLICLAFGTDLTIVESTTVLLFVCLLTLVPISIGGLGLGQAGDIYMFGLFGVSPETALGVSLVHQVMNYGYAFIGGLLFLGWKSSEKANAV